MNEKSKILVAKIRRFHALGFKQTEIAKKLKVSQAYVNEILQKKQEPSKVTQNLMLHCIQITQATLANKRETLAELLGFPVDDWTNAQVEMEFFKLMETES